MYHYINKLYMVSPDDICWTIAGEPKARRPIANGSSSGNVDNDGGSDASDRSSSELAVR
ncbi:hypothetical protein EC988_008360 [Linderina pennispora]|nr:hypothetical protein EC988_008360 [Linderina pennispora]